MARRRGNASDAGGLFIIGAMFVFMILGALLPAIVSFVAYAGPPFLAYQWLMARRRIAKVPTLPDPDVFQWQPMRLRLAALCFPRHRASDLLGEIHRRGEASGIALTKASDERRFDVRKKLGRELNDELDAAETALASANERFEREFVAARLSLPDWQGAFSECASARSALVASGAAIVAYAMTFPCLLWLELPLVQSLSTQAAWVIEPLRVVYGPAACATLVGAVVLATARMLSEHHFAEHLLVEYRAAWSAIEQNVNIYDVTTSEARIAFSQLFPDQEHPRRQSRGQRSEEQQRERSRAPVAPPVLAWHEVLGVAEAASRDAIQAAYRKKVREYHPDLLDRAGPKVKAVAQAETTVLNAALQEARRLGRV